MNNLIEIYCAVDDFVKIFLPEWKKTLIANKKNKSLHLMMVILATTIFVLAYFLYDSMVNVFQVYSYSHHFPPSLFIWTNIISLRIAFFASFLMYLKRLQSVRYQREFSSEKVYHNRRT